MDETARLLAESLSGPSEAIASVQAIARAIAPDAHDLEASVRIDAKGVVRGGRMMLERARAATGEAIAAGLGLPWTDEARALTACCASLGLPLIVGWDVSGAAPLYKLYANASDASAAQRETLHARLGIAGAPLRGQILGLNVGEASAIKLYVQRPTAAELPEGAPMPAALRDAVGAAWVASFDVAGAEVTPRAIFVATLHDQERSVLEALEALSGRRWPELRPAFPFEPGPLRQLGWSTEGSVTAYAKRRGAAAPVHALAPMAIFRRGEVEVGLYVTPSVDTPRAFLRTAAQALTFRTRQGTPEEASLEALGRWAAARLEAEEPLDAPPAGWTRIEDANG